MTPMEFVKNVFGAFGGVVDMEVDCGLRSLNYAGRVSELGYACGVDKDTFYALNSFATCPRSYMLRYLLEKPLSIPFFEQVQEVVREVIADEAMGRIRRDEMGTRFEKLYDEIVKGPFPIHQQKVDWSLSWKQSVGDYLAHYSPEWEQRGWHIEDAYVPVSVTIDGWKINGVIDLLLENEAGEYAIVIHDAGSTVYRARRTGEIRELIETKRDIQDLKRRAYVYGEALACSKEKYAGKIREVVLNLYKPKSKAPFELVSPWSDDEHVDALRWVGWAANLVDRAKSDRDWPAAELLRSGKGGTPEPDVHFCMERCPSCLRCRWVAYHPEELKPFTDVTKVTVVPQKYIGAKIRLRDDLNRHQKIMSYGEVVTLADGRSGGVTKLKAVLQKMGLEVIGDLEGKRISDFFETVGCGATKLEFILKLFYDICP